MTAAQLIKQLQELPPDTKLMLQIDPEGNGYHDVQGADPAIYDNDTVYSLNWSAADCGLEPDEWKALKADTSKRVAILFP